VTRLDPDAAIYPPGPWTHRDIAANGARFHIVEMGTGPTVLFLHGFPTFWWSWRTQLVAVAQAGFHAVAMDLRGYGGSDHPPEGYDPRTAADDVEAVLRCLGVDQAVIVGHGWGGFIAWSVAALHPEVVRAIAPVAMPHPRCLRAQALRNPIQTSALRYAARWQLPFWPEHALQAKDGERIDALLHEWSATAGWPTDDDSMRYRVAFCRWPTAHTAVEYHRWAFRSALRPDGLRYMAALREPVQCDVLQVFGTEDPMVQRAAIDGSSAYVSGTFSVLEIPAGHFPHEENPNAVTDALLTWLAKLPASASA
jgi:pimeloyl-ACP methyl ester carboxylesterase